MLKLACRDGFDHGNGRRMRHISANTRSYLLKGDKPMKRIAWLLPVVVGSTLLMYAQQSGRQMSGTICDSRCVVRNRGDHTSCDPNCNIRECVFIDDNTGHADKVINQQECSSYLGQHVTMTAEPKGTPGNRSLVIQDIKPQ